MKNWIAGTIVLFSVVVGIVATAYAACPPGTRYDCQTTASGKQSCGCR